MHDFTLSLLYISRFSREKKPHPEVFPIRWLLCIPTIISHFPPLHYAFVVLNGERVLGIFHFQGLFKLKCHSHCLIRGPTEDIISYFTLMSSEIHYYDIIEKMGSWTLMSSEV